MNKKEKESEHSKDLISSIDYTNVYLILGLKRGGHHGVVNWLRQQTDKDSLYWDQCQLIDNERNLLSVGPIRYYDNTNNINLQYLLVEFNKNKYSSVYNCFFSIESFGCISNKDARIGSLKEVLRIDSITPSHFIIINRDFYNWMASCFILGGSLYRFRHKMTKIWKEFIRESLNANILKDHSVVDINYNKWFADISYRKVICSKLGLVFTDNGLNDILTNGGGSSFTKLDYQGKAQEMDVLNRYKLCLDNKDYLDLIDDEIRDLSERYFGFVPQI